MEGYYDGRRGSRELNKGGQPQQRPPHYPTPAAPYSGHARPAYPQARPGGAYGPSAAVANTNYAPDMGRDFNNFANNDDEIDHSNKWGFWRFSKYGVAVLVFILIVIFVIGMQLNPQFPVYKVDSLTVTNFSTDPTLTGSWNISATVYNPNKGFETIFPDFKLEILFNKSVIAVAYSSSFRLEKLEHKQCDLEALTNSTVVDALHDQQAVLEAIRNEQASSGSISVEMKTSAATDEKASSLALCEDLKIVFLNSSVGVLDNSSQQRLCPIDISRVSPQHRYENAPPLTADSTT